MLDDTIKDLRLVATAPKAATDHPRLETDAEVIPFPTPAADQTAETPSAAIALTQLDVDRAIDDFVEYFAGRSGGSAKSTVDFRKDGLHFQNVALQAGVSLANRVLPFSVHFSNCRFLGLLDMRWLQANALTFHRCVFQGPVRAGSMKIGGSVDFSHATSLVQLDLSVSQITGDLVLVGAELQCEDRANEGYDDIPEVRRGSALFCGGIQVHSILMDRLKCRGRIFLDSARLTGILKAANAILERHCGNGTLPSGRFDHMVLTAVDADIDGAVILGEEGRSITRHHGRHSFTAMGQVNLSNSRIGGDLICANGKFYSAYFAATAEELRPFADLVSPRDDVVLAALNASRAKVEGAVILDDGFIAFGEVRFNSVVTSGLFECGNANLIGALPVNLDGAQDESHVYVVERALSMERAQIGNKLSLTKGFHSIGRVNLRNITIKGDFDCMGGTLQAAWTERTYKIWELRHERLPECLAVSGGQIEGSVFLLGDASPRLNRRRSWLRQSSREEQESPAKTRPLSFRAYGHVRFRGTHIDGNLHLGGGRYETLPLPDGKDFKGELPYVALFQSAQVKGTTFHIEDTLEETPAVCFRGSVSFSGMHTGCWVDSIEAWPQCRDKRLCRRAVVELNGLTYGSLRGPTSGEARLLWLVQQPAKDVAETNRKAPATVDGPSGFKTHPWEHCARLLRETGYPRDAGFLRRHEMRFLRVKDKRSWWRGFLNLALGIFAGHGHRLLYALLWAIWLVGVGTAVAHYGWDRHYIVPSQAEVLADKEYDFKHRRPSDYPSFHPLLYAVDMALPAGSLRQGPYWIAIDSRSMDNRPEVSLRTFAAQTNRAYQLLLRRVHNGQFGTRRVISAVLLGAALSGLFGFFLWWELRLNLPECPAFHFTRRDGARLYWRVLNRGRSLILRNLPTVLVLLVIASFVVVMGLYLANFEYLFGYFDDLDSIENRYFGMSLPHSWAVIETLLGWFIVTAIGIGFAASLTERRL